MTRTVGGRPAEADALDRATRFGDAVFETFRVHHGAVRALPRHLARLRRSAAHLGLDAPSDDALRREVARACAGAGTDLFVRLSLVRAAGTGLRGLPSASIAVVDVAPRPAPPDSLEACSAPFGGPGPLDGTKTPAYAGVIAAFRALPAAEELVRLDPAGQVTEASAGNVFALVGGVLRTPPRALCGLPGITRELLLEAGTIAGVAVREGLVCVRTLETAEEAFVTSSVRGVVPLVRLDGVPLRRGPATGAIATWLEHHPERAPVVDESPGTR